MAAARRHGDDDISLTFLATGGGQQEKNIAAFRLSMMIPRTNTYYYTAAQLAFKQIPLHSFSLRFFKMIIKT